MNVVDWPPPRQPRRRGRLAVLVLLAVLFLGGGTTLTYYVESLWFGSLGFSDVFWTTLNVRFGVFFAFAILTFAVLYGAFWLLKPDRLGEIAGGTVIVNGQPVRLPIEPMMRLAAIVLSAIIALGTGLSMGADWSTFALYWNSGEEALGSAQPAASQADPIFGRPIAFYFFTLPAWRLVAGWLMTLAVIVFLMAIALTVVVGGTRLLEGRKRGGGRLPSLRGVSAAFALVLIALAIQVYLGRFSRMYQDHVIFSGVSYTDANISITGLLVVSAALVMGAVVAAANAAFREPKLTWLGAAIAPAVATYILVALAGAYVTSFVVKPNELVRERPYITHNIDFTRRAFALDQIAQVPYPADTGLDALDPANNQETLQNIRLWDWRALQDTLRQIQEIRTYYDFPDIDIDRYQIDGRVRQVMLAVRELNIDRLPESSRNWINEKLIYTHGYGITMNPVNEFTPEGMPKLLLSNMPVESTVRSLAVSRPEIYFGELTNTNVYVKTRQKEFNYPQGDTNNVTAYEGRDGIVLGGFFRRLIIAIEQGDLTRLPFSDDVTAESRLLKRRNIRERASTLAPFLVFDPDPYIVIGDDGRLFWMMDAFTTSASYPYSRHYGLGRSRVNYMRNSVKVTVDAYDGTVAFYVFDAADPIIAAYRSVFPTLFKDASEIPATLRAHVRYPELLLEMQAAAYGLYHMMDPDVFYNREDLWSVASEVTMNAQREQSAQTIEPNFVLMKLPGEQTAEFVEMLPFTPANRNNLIGWIAGRSDGQDYGKTIVYNFPKTKLVDGPLQIEARIDQNAQLSGQFSLWNQQGSNVRRGGLIVIPVGRALLYAEPIFLQAEHSPMPEMRLVVLALQDRVAYGPTFEIALAALLGKGPSMLAVDPSAPATEAPPVSAAAPSRTAPAAPSAGTDTNTLISEAARDLAEYQRLTAEGRLAEAGARLEALKKKLDQLAGQTR
jgi:uncharacterized membrane protein (UPF0182 family)